MDKGSRILVGAVSAALGIVLFATVYLLPGQGTQTVSTQTTSTAVSAPPTSTSTTSTSTSTSTSTTHSTTTTTTTTLPQYIPLKLESVSKCRESQLGMMNSIIAAVPGSFDGKWRSAAKGALLLECDGNGKITANEVLYKGGKTVGLGDPLAGSYRLMAKCGHTSVTDDYNDCKELGIYLNTSATQNSTS